MKKCKLISDRSNRIFGFVFSAFFIWLFYIFKNYKLSSLFLVSSFGFFILALARPRLLKELNSSWIQLGVCIGLLTQPIVMFFLYFVILTPFSLIIRIFKRDLLGLKIDRGSRNSYWLNTTKNRNSNLKNQF